MSFIKKPYDLTIRGKHKTWSFEIYGTEEHSKDWEADGLNVGEILNTIPEWAGPYARLWCIVQDLLNFRNPWKDK